MYATSNMTYGNFQRRDVSGGETRVSRGAVYPDQRTAPAASPIYPTRGQTGAAGKRVQVCEERNETAGDEDDAEIQVLKRLQRQEYLAPAPGVYDEPESPASPASPIDPNYTIPTFQRGPGDYSRDALEKNIRACGMIERSVRGDGNCQFRALSKHLFQSQDLHADVRKEVVEHMAAMADLFIPYADVDPCHFDGYLAKLARDGVWGDHLSLQAAADLYQLKIVLVTSHTQDVSGGNNGAIIGIRPRDSNGTADESLVSRTVWLSFLEEMGAEHYNPLFAQ